MTAAVAVGAAVISSAPVASAAVVVVDIPDAKNVIFSHMGADEWIFAFTGKGFTASLERSSGDGLLGFGSSSNLFTAGTDLNPVFGVNSTQYRNDSGFYTNGASPGVNYARLDLDADSVYETVVEFDFGPAFSDFSTHFITRYAYDDGGADLNISQAVTALNAVPEPSSALLIASSAALCFLRRRR